MDYMCASIFSQSKTKLSQSKEADEQHSIDALMLIRD